MRLLQFPLEGAIDQTHLTRVFKAAYDVLYTYMIGNSRKNALYFAKYIDFFQTQISVKVRYRNIHVCFTHLCVLMWKSHISNWFYTRRDTRDGDVYIKWSWEAKCFRTPVCSSLETPAPSFTIGRLAHPKKEAY